MKKQLWFTALPVFRLYWAPRVRLEASFAAGWDDANKDTQTSS